MSIIGKTYSIEPFADLHEADLSRTDLSEANLRWANLHGVLLSSGTVGDGQIIRSAQTPEYNIVICGDLVIIGCQQHRLHEWMSFSDADILKMVETKQAACAGPC